MIFPTFKRKRLGYVNLNTYAIDWLKRNHAYPFEGDNPLLDPLICQRMVEECHTTLGLDYSYGGWLEDRSTLWRGSYLDRDRAYIHLGLDINAPVGTPVALDMRGRVVLIDNDAPLVGGWGTRVMIELAQVPIVLIYGHLSGIRHQVGSELGAGEVFAEIGPSDSNGVWYTHVHVQAMTLDAYANFLDNPSGLDGYGREDDIPKLARLFPDPMRYIAVR